MKIKFCGAAKSVTGSCHMLITEKHKVLLDCGQFQGGKNIEQENYEEFPFDPKEIDCVILSHAHIDHSGRIPLLVKRGFTGQIYCTDATADLLEVMLKDSGYIHEKEATWKNQKAMRAGKPLVEPLYTFEDSVKALKYVVPVLYDQLIEINDEMKIVFNDAGHILGSAITEIWVTEGEKITKTVYSGDLGVADRPILRNPTIIKKADNVIMEATYGNRLHPEASCSVDRLIEIIVETKNRGGTVVIPSFAVGRTQELIYQLNRVYEEREDLQKELKDVFVYIDSPMATTTTEVFRKNAQVFDEETKAYILKGDNPLDFKNLKFTRSAVESQELNTNKMPKIIISASGMCEAGRIRHHLKHNLWDSRNSIVFVGYQAEGTLGRFILSGAKEVNLFGEVIKVNAQIHNLEGFSGHADQNGLLHWLSGFRTPPKEIFLVHGEEQSKIDFAKKVKSELGYDTKVVEGYIECDLSSNITELKSAVEERITEREIENSRAKLAGIHDSVESIIYNSQLVMNKNVPPEKMVEINNQILELEKSLINLGSKITEDL